MKTHHSLSLSSPSLWLYSISPASLATRLSRFCKLLQTKSAKEFSTFAFYPTANLRSGSTCHITGMQRLLFPLFLQLLLMRLLAPAVLLFLQLICPLILEFAVQNAGPTPYDANDDRWYAVICGRCVGWVQGNFRVQRLVNRAPGNFHRSFALEDAQSSTSVKLQAKCIGNPADAANLTVPAGYGVLFL
uniref:Uncharacterized protein n=1 Tax=Moniliophthora roreri TaxID=221103 RepID=A0A0W0EWB7_MONRR